MKVLFCTLLTLISCGEMRKEVMQPDRKAQSTSLISQGQSCAKPWETGSFRFPESERHLRCESGHRPYKYGIHTTERTKSSGKVNLILKCRNEDDRNFRFNLECSNEDHALVFSVLPALSRDGYGAAFYVDWFCYSREDTRPICPSPQFNNDDKEWITFALVSDRYGAGSSSYYASEGTIGD